jgi:hypothetical protein
MRSRSTIIIIAVTMMITFISCLRADRKNFTAYQYHPTELATVSVPIDGIYFLENYPSPSYWDPPFAFFLNSDGSVTALDASGVSEVPEQKFWQHPEEYLKSISPSYGRESGHYRVDGASIVMEIFITGIPGLPFTAKSIRFRGYVGNDSTIVFEKSFCHWCPDKIDWFPESGNVNLTRTRYRFYRSSSLPDTHNIWFRNDRWYRKNVWYNRRDSIENKR